MDTRDKALRDVSKKIDELDDLLEELLPKTDKKHREEIFDILSLVRMRSEQYINEYGITEEFYDELKL